MHGRKYNSQNIQDTQDIMQNTDCEMDDSLSDHEADIQIQNTKYKQIQIHIE